MVSGENFVLVFVFSDLGLVAFKLRCIHLFFFYFYFILLAMGVCVIKFLI